MVQHLSLIISLSPRLSSKFYCFHLLWYIMLKIVGERRGLTFPGEMRQGSILETIRDSLPADSLLTHAGYHLRDVDEGTL